MTGDVAHSLALVLARHQRLDPPGGRCSCGHETALGDLVSAHVADAILASGLVVEPTNVAAAQWSVRVATDAAERLEVERDDLAARLGCVREALDRLASHLTVNESEADVQAVFVSTLRKALDGEA